MNSGKSNPIEVVNEETRKSSRHGVLYGLAAYTAWGSFPLFFKALHGAMPLEIVAHRIFWAAVYLMILSLLTRQIGVIRKTVKDRICLLTLCGSTLLIATNWLTFLYAIQADQVLQSSLGYFMTPLVSVLLGCLVLRERLNRLQTVSVLLALAGVLNLSLQHGTVPWISLILAGTFGLYGLLRKMARVDAMAGLTIETALLAPVALGYIGYLASQQQSAFLAGSLRLDLLLPLSGVVTATPLLAFVGAARRLRMITIGFLQYITPSLHFVLAVFLYRETFTAAHLASFLCIWSALVCYSLDALLARRHRPAAPELDAAAS